MKKTGKEKDDEQKSDKPTLAQAIAEMAKEGINIGTLGKAHLNTKMPVISTGITSLDIALGVGGIPEGRIVEIYGGEAAGKTSLCLSIIAQAQKKGLTCAFVDAEHALDPAYASRIGVDLDSILISQPDSGDQALNIVEKLVKTGDVKVIVVDSVAALVPEADLDKDIGQLGVGNQARLMGDALRKLTAIVNQTKTIVIFVNQLRQKVGVMYGSPDTTPGGLALKFYASVRLDVRRTEAFKVGEKPIGNRVRVKIVKNKVSAPYRQAEFCTLSSHGPSRSLDLVEFGEEKGVITKKGNSFVYAGESLGMGLLASADKLYNDPELADKVAADIIAACDGEAK